VKLIKLATPEEDDSTSRPANVMIVMVGINTLKPAPWNPEKRMSTRALKPLIKLIQEEGFDPFRPILISKDGFIGDGHRRWLAAKHLGIPRVPVVYTDRTVEDLWAGNAGARPVSAREWFSVSILAGVEVPGNFAAMIDEMRPVLGDEGLRYLIDRGIAPGIWKLVWKISLYCKRPDNKFLRQTTYWLVKHKMQDKVRKAVYGPEDERIDPRALVQFIESDLPMRVRWEVAA